MDQTNKKFVRLCEPLCSYDLLHTPELNEELIAFMLITFFLSEPVANKLKIQEVLANFAYVGTQSNTYIYGVSHIIPLDI